MPEIDHFQYNVTVGYVTVVVDADQQVPAFWAHPQIGGPFPGLVLLHDNRGLTEHMRALTHRFAEVGYYVIAPDLFEGQRASEPEEAEALEERYQEDTGPKVIATLRALETHHKCNAKMALIGWNFGAGIAIRMGLERDDVMAIVAFYGDASPYLDQLKDLHCPLLKIYGADDPLVPRTAQQVKTQLAASDLPHEVEIYPEAGHGFYNDMQPSHVPKAAEAAWHKTLSFLHQHQGQPPSPPNAAPGYFKPGRVY